MIPSRLGSCAATIVALIGVAYVAVLGIGIARFGLERPITDPVLAVMEVLTLLSAPALLIALAAVRDGAAPDRRPWGTVSLSFAIIFAGLTSAVHFIELTAVRQRGGGGIAWPSAGYAAELLAWDWFLGLALLFAAPVFAGESSAERRVRRGFRVAGTLCLVGTIGPLLGAMALQRVGIAGYALVLPVAFAWLAELLRVPPGGRSAA
ncbi:MAG TPA: hypothetical protein VGD77_17825 [Gemmatimonadaceae bacterium]